MGRVISRPPFCYNTTTVQQQEQLARYKCKNEKKTENEEDIVDNDMLRTLTLIK